MYPCSVRPWSSPGVKEGSSGDWTADTTRMQAARAGFLSRLPALPFRNWPYNLLDLQQPCLHLEPRGHSGSCLTPSVPPFASQLETDASLYGPPPGLVGLAWSVFDFAHRSKSRMAHNPPQVPAWPSSANMAVQGTADVPTAERAASSARLLREYARRCRRALRRILRIKSPSTQQSARPPSLQSSSSWHTPPSPPASSRHTPSPPPPPGQTPTNPLQDLPSTSRPPSPTRSPPIPLAAPHSPTTEPPLATGRMPTQQPFNFGVLDQVGSRSIRSHSLTEGSGHHEQRQDAQFECTRQQRTRPRR